MQPFAAQKDHGICKGPIDLTPLARAITSNQLEPDANGEITAPDRPGLGMEVEVDGVRPFLIETEITVRGEVLYRTPELRA